MAQVPIAAFAAATLVAIGQPVTEDNVAKMMAWWQWESGGGNAAHNNPADIIIGAVPGAKEAPGTTPFNTFGPNGQYHVANYTDLHEGVRMTGLYIQSQPKIFHAFDKDKSYSAGLADITSAMASFASPQFMQNIQNTPKDKALAFGKTAMNHGEQVSDTDVNQLTADVGGVGEWFFPFYLDTLGTPNVSVGTGTLGPTLGDVGGPEIPNPLDALSSGADVAKAIWGALSSGAFWKRALYVVAGLVLIFGGLFVLAGRLQKAGDIPTPSTPVPV